MKTTVQVIPPTPAPPRYKIELELNSAELFALYSIIQRIGGSSFDGPRAVAQALNEAIRELRSDFFIAAPFSVIYPFDGIYFDSTATEQFKNFKL